MRLKKSAMIAGLMCVGAHAHAAQHVLDGMGFDIVYDDAFVDLFGVPFLSGGTTLVFMPTQFSAASSAGWDMSHSTIAFNIHADAGYVLDGLSVVEQGSYMLLGESSQVFAGGQSYVLDYQTHVLSTAALTGAGLGELDQRGQITAGWQATSMHDFDAGVTGARVALSSVLGANGGNAGGLAFIEKNYVAVTAVVSAVPENGISAMLLAGLGLIGLSARRRAAR